MNALIDWMERDLGRRRRAASASAGYPAQPTTTPEDTLREAGVSRKRQAEYQRKMSSLLAGRA